MKKQRQEAKITFHRFERLKKVTHVKEIVNDVLAGLKNQLKYKQLMSGKAWETT